MMLVRLPHWRSALSTCIEEALQRPFEWGRHDCAIFAADAVLAMTGVDPAAEWRGRYRSKTGAVRMLRKVIGASEGADLVAPLFPEVAPHLASDGDIAVIEQNGIRILGVISGPMFASTAPDGLGFVPRSEVIKAFHIPFEGEVV